MVHLAAHANLVHVRDELVGAQTGRICGTSLIHLRDQMLNGEKLVIGATMIAAAATLTTKLLFFFNKMSMKIYFKIFCIYQIYLHSMTFKAIETYLKREIQREFMHS